MAVAGDISLEALGGNGRGFFFASTNKIMVRIN